MLVADEIRDAVQHLAVAAQVAGARQRQMECGAGAGGVADVVDEQSQVEAVLRSAQKRAFYRTGESARAARPADGWRSARRSRVAIASETSRRPALVRDWALLMSQANPIRLFVTHIWEDSDDYLRVFEYLESARNFFYRNTARPISARSATRRR